MFVCAFIVFVLACVYREALHYKMLLESEMVMKILPLSVDLTQNYPFQPHD
jgi:hypothetical protein